MSHADLLNERPARGIWSWAVMYAGEPRKGAPAVHVSVWIPKVVAGEGIGDIADYLEARLGWRVHRNAGWSEHKVGDETELTEVTVLVRAREIRKALAEEDHNAR